MKKQGWMEIELRSDLCAASGDAVSGIVDTDISHDCGLPVIPAKRLQGCLRDVALEMVDNNVLSGEAVQWLFGVPGQRSGALQLADARLFEVEKQKLSTADYECMRMQARQICAAGSFTDADILELFTTVRTQTAIHPELGTAIEGSLRSMRVLRRGVVLRCDFSLDTENDQCKQIGGALEKCVKGLRHIGLGITRGFGEVHCVLHWEDAAVQGNLITQFESCFSHLQQEDEMELFYCINLETPLILPGSNGLYGSSAYDISGGVIKGALAKAYIQDHHLQEKAHEDSGFKTIFLRDGVEFGCAFPMRSKHPISVFYPCPVSFCRLKNEVGSNVLYDLALGREPEQQLRNENHLIQVNNQQVELCIVKKEVRIHHARPVDRSIGHAVNDDFSVDNGQLFQYVALSAGQSFIGRWRGGVKEIRALLKCLDRRGSSLRLGRSRKAEYGQVRFSLLPGSTVQATRQTLGKYFLVQLRTPMILRDEKGRISPDPAVFLQLLKKQLGVAFDWVPGDLPAKFLKFTTVAGYHAKWRLPKPQKTALAAGTVLVIKTKNDETIDAQAIETRYWGDETSDGYGMIGVQAIDDTIIDNREKVDAPQFVIVDNEKSVEGDAEKGWLGKKLQNERQLRETWEIALQTIESRLEEEIALHATAIEQLIAWSNELSPCSHEALQKYIGSVANEDKKDKMKKFIANSQKFYQCLQEENLDFNGQEADFILLYLQLAKWREREENHGE